eukprot:TRINITY_DN3576_c0_g2_i1.p1 TRINITY_DN3576_c0_g2~~TRINITY_DN3576_c0_g2_i1.p1  ORF type:complete len:916 (-),score=388.94 TRINITY_DN3576_c0_g2_i1:154-2901(-)
MCIRDRYQRRVHGETAREQQAHHAAKLTAAKEEVARIEALRQALQTRLEREQADSRSNTAALESITAERDGLLRERKDKNAELAAKDSALSEIKRNVESLRKVIEEQQFNFSEEKKELERALRSLTDEKKKVEVLLSSQEDEAQKSYSKVKEYLESSSKVNKELQERVKEKEKELQEVHLQLERATARVKEVTSEVNCKGKELAEAKTALTEARNQLKKRTEEGQLREAVLAEQQRLTEVERQATKAAQTRIALLEARIKALETELEEREQQLDATNEKLAKAEMNTSKPQGFFTPGGGRSFKANTTNLNLSLIGKDDDDTVFFDCEEHEKSRRNFDSARGTPGPSLKDKFDLVGQLEELRKRCRELEALVKDQEKLEKNLSEACDRIEELGQELERAGAELGEERKKSAEAKRLGDELESLRNEMKECQEKIVALNEERERRKAEASMFQRNLADAMEKEIVAMTERENLLEELNEANERLKTLKEEYAAKRNSEIQQMTASFAAEREDYELKLQQVNVQLSEVKAFFAEKTKELDEIQLKLAETQNTSALTTEETGNLRVEIEELKEQKMQLERNLEEASQQLAAAEHQYQAQINELSEKIQLLSKQIERDEFAIKNEKYQRDIIMKKSAGLQKEKEALSVEISSLRSENTDLRIQVDQLIQQQLESKEVRVSEERVEYLESAVREALEAKEAITEELMVLREELESRDLQIFNLESQLENADKEKSGQSDNTRELTELLKAKEHENSELIARISEIDLTLKALAVEQERNHQTIDTLKKLVQMKDSEITKMRLALATEKIATPIKPDNDQGIGASREVEHLRRRIGELENESQILGKKNKTLAMENTLLMSQLKMKGSDLAHRRPSSGQENMLFSGKRLNASIDLRSLQETDDHKVSSFNCNVTSPYYNNLR